MTKGRVLSTLASSLAMGMRMCSHLNSMAMANARGFRLHPHHSPRTLARVESSSQNVGIVLVSCRTDQLIDCHRTSPPENTQDWKLEPVEFTLARLTAGWFSVSFQTGATHAPPPFSRLSFGPVSPRRAIGPSSAVPRPAALTRARRHPSSGVFKRIRISAGIRPFPGWRTRRPLYGETWSMWPPRSVPARRVGISIIKHGYGMAHVNKSI